MLYGKGKKCSCVLSSQMTWKVGFAKFTLGGPFYTKSYFKRPEAEMGFCFPACWSPQIHSTGRCPTRPKEVVGEHCAGQPASATLLCTTGTFLAFGSLFCPLLGNCEGIILFSSKEEKIIENWIQMWHFLGLFPECSCHCFCCPQWGCLVNTFPWVPWSILLSGCLDFWWP